MFTRLRKRGRKDKLIGLLTKQIQFAIIGADIAQHAAVGEGSGRELRDEINDVEHRGDDARRKLVRTMGSTLSTHLEREDIYRVSRSIDDVLDNLRDFVREVGLWKVVLDQEAFDALGNVSLSLRHLEEAVSVVTLSSARSEALAASQEANTLRRYYQESLTRIFSGELTMDTLKKREAMRRIDIIGLRLLEASDAVLDGLVKRSL